MKYKIYYICSNCMKEVYSEETVNKKEADSATGFTDYCAYCNCSYDFYPKRREVIND